MSRESVLLCDDDATIRAVVTIALSKGGGFDVAAVESGAEALARFANDPADLVILDVLMPELDGPATLAALRALPGGGRVPVVFLSAKDDPDEIEYLQSLGVAAVMRKPFNVLTFAKDVRDCLDRAREAAGAARDDCR